MSRAAEIELQRVALLVAEVIEERTGGDFDEMHGNADSDLLAAVEEFEAVAGAWRREQGEERGEP
jgi:hypothetical protein